MASLAANFKVGSANTSSLIKSANTIQNQLATYQDDVARITYENSAKTDADLKVYQDYLQGRISSLQSSGSVADATKALNMQQEVITSIKSNTSANIQRANIQVMAGNASLQDKYNVIVDQYSRAVSIGDDALAQSLMSQAYSVSQSIQYQAEQSAQAAKDLMNAKITSIDEGVSQIKDVISNANAAFSAQGPKFMDQQSANYLKSLGLNTKGEASIFSALAGSVGMVNKGVVLNSQSKYAQGTYTPGSVLDLYTKAIALDPSKAAQYQSYIDGYLNGDTGIKLPGGSSINYNSLMNTVYAGNAGNAPYEAVQGADGSWSVKQGNITGYTWGQDQNGNAKIIANYSFFSPDMGSIKATDGKTSIKDSLNAAGLNVKTDSNGSVWLSATNKSTFLSKIQSDNAPIQGVMQKNGSIEFTSNGNLYVMVQDGKGLWGVQQVGQDGNVMNNNVSGQYGFTPKTVNGDTISSLFTGLGGLPMGTSTTANSVVSVMNQSMVERINALHNATMQATAPLNVVKSLPTPNLTVAPPAPTPQVKVNSVASNLSGLGKPATVEQVQNAAPGAKVQNAGGGTGLQGGGVSLQGGGGGGGIRLQ